MWTEEIASSSGVTYLNVNIVTAGGWFLRSSFILFWGVLVADSNVKCLGPIA